MLCVTRFGMKNGDLLDPAHEPLHGRPHLPLRRRLRAVGATAGCGRSPRRSRRMAGENARLWAKTPQVINISLEGSRRSVEPWGGPMDKRWVGAVLVVAVTSSCGPYIPHGWVRAGTLRTEAQRELAACELEAQRVIP